MKDTPPENCDGLFQGMDELLKEALQHSPAQRKTQIKYILQQLNQKTEEEGVWVEDSGDEGQDDDEDNEVKYDWSVHIL